MDTFDLTSLNLPGKEQKILESAIRIFSEKGFSAATTSEIAKDAGVAEGTIFRYFKTKKDILRAILIQMINLMSGKVVIEQVEKILLESGDKDLRTVLKELLYDRIKLIDSVFPMARVVITEALFHEDVREAIFQNIITRALDAFSIFHKKMVERGMIRSDIEPQVLFRAILGNMFMLLAQRKMFGDKFPIEDIDGEFDNMVDVLLHGISDKV